MTPLADRRVRTLPGGTGEHELRSLLHALPAALAGSGPAVHVVDPARPKPEPLPLVASPVAAVLATSGSTSGSGRLVALDGAGLVASANATYERLAGPGQWVACLPAHHVAGFQVLVRSVVAGTDPVLLDTSSGFRAAELAAGVGRLRPDLPGYLSLVPTQLARVLEDDDVVRVLRGLAAILVGGARTAPAVLDAARRAGLPVVTTYGMTETGGGCVYDGVPLDGVDVAVDPESRVWITGPVLARGYLGDARATAETFPDHEGRRWLRTADRGALADGMLTVLGRLDDTLITGGLNVSAAAVEQVVGTLPEVRDVVVVGVPDEEWGTLVTAVVAGAPVGLDRLRAVVGDRLGRAAAPRALVQVPELPTRGPGKLDRIAATALARERLAARAAGTQRL